MIEEEDFDAGDQGHVRKKRTKAELKAERDEAELQQILDTPQGRYFVWRILERCGIYHTNTHIDGRAQFQEGRRSIGLWLLDEVLTANPNVYTLMRNEAVSRDTTGK